MRKALAALFITALLAGGGAFAQGMSDMYAGISTGVTLVGGFAAVPVVGHFGVKNVGVENLDVRGDVGYYVTGTGLELGVDAIYNYPAMTDLTVYGGAGPRVLIGGGAAFGFAVLGGAEYMVTPNIGVTAEANVTPYFAGPLAVALFGFQAGVNYHF